MALYFLCHGHILFTYLCYILDELNVNRSPHGRRQEFTSVGQKIQEGLDGRGTPNHQVQIKVG